MFLGVCLLCRFAPLFSDESLFLYKCSNFFSFTEKGCKGKTALKE